MGMAAIGALVATALAYLTQSPRYLARQGLNARQAQVRLRMLTGLALALQLLAFGFFFAGVPLDRPETAVLPTASPSITPATAGEIVALMSADLTATAVAQASPTPTFTRPAANTPVTGAFVPPPTATEAAFATAQPSPTAVTTAIITPTGSASTATATAVDTLATQTGNAVTTSPTTPTPFATNTPAPTATPSATPTPTFTPSPTPTPTPIEGKTAVVNSPTGGNLGVQRVPGGAVIASVPNGGTVILLPGHANYGGNLWQEVRTLEGVRGWVPASVLIFSEGDNASTGSTP